jgi:AcrR family transcriptional regulator
VGAAMRSRRPAGRARGSHQVKRAGMRGEVADVQRARILAAMFNVVAELGSSEVSVAHVVVRAGVSRRTFYEMFVDREDCLRATFEQAVAYAAERVVPAFQGADGWRERVKAGLVALLAFLDEESVIGQMLIAESLAACPAALERRAQVLAQVTRAVAQGEHEAKAPSPTPLAAEGVVGGALSILQVRLREPDHDPLLELANPLMSMIVLPYLGASVARRELDRPTPERNVCAADRPLLGDPFKAAGMRLTYRTMRVLRAVGEQPNSSNRTVSNAAGISDQGQASKLLSRLERLGLISKGTPDKGAPNAWCLTEVGQRVERSIGAHTTEAPSSRFN